MRIHELKTWPSFFDAVERKERTFEVRKNDRDFAVGDLLVLRYWDPELEAYQPKHLVAHVCHVLHGGSWGVESGHVVMSIRQASPAKYDMALVSRPYLDAKNNVWRRL